jgi:hypothetical protein
MVTSKLTIVEESLAAPRQVSATTRRHGPVAKVVGIRGWRHHRTAA